MQAQVVLIPAESKKLIAMAVANMASVKRALKNGLVVMHPSSSTYFLVEELTGHKPPTNYWAAGIIVPKGTCGEMGMHMAIMKESSHTTTTPGKKWDAGSFKFSWVVDKGKFVLGERLDSLLNRMGPDDFYVKGCNAVDTSYTAGVLIGAEVEGGTTGLVQADMKRNGFQVLLLAGLEKLVPFPIKEAAKYADKKKCEYATGTPCALYPCEGTTITELQAVEILSGAKAIPIAAGGVGGAEGAVLLSVNGEREQVNQAIMYIEKAKGARLPPVRTDNCWDCSSKLCTFPPRDKPWA